MRREIPIELNWVSVRAGCSLASVFTALCNGAQQDVDTFLQLTPTAKIDVHVADDTAFSVQRLDVPRPHAQFFVNARAIEVAIGQTTFRFTVGINDEGRCVLKDDEDKEYEQWQVRKLALEKLFFPKS